jgi:EAL domain-containing protein (putative c-di-GMP-specific phosphodiesterase class I)
LQGLTQRGLKVSIDDFGIGYSSLAYLTRFPLSELKIDRSFVQRALVEKKSMAIVSAIIAMAKELGVITVAEGVETREQLEFLRARGCEQFQGYLFSRPAPPAQMEALLRRDLVRKDGSWSA